METGNSLKFRLVRLLAWLYKPIALARLRYGISAGLIEGWLFQWVAALYRR